MSFKILLAFIFSVGLLLRLFLIPNPGFEADVSFWKSWGLAVFDKGVVEGIKVTNNNYPTPFAYVLGFMIWLYSLFADPHNFNQFWSNTNTLFLFVSKIFPILADFGIAAVFLYVGKNAKTLGFPGSPSRSQGPPGRYRKGLLPGVCFSVYEAIAIVYLLNPIALADGAWWGQVDSLGVFFFLLALIVLLKRKPFLAGILYMVALMTKLQNMIYGPLFFLFAWQLIGFNGLIKVAAGATLAFFGLNMEFLLSRNMNLVFNSLTQNYDYFPWMSLNAFNLWWIVSGAHGMQVSDKIAALGIVNAKTMGLLLFSSFYLFAFVRQLVQFVKLDKLDKFGLKTFLESLIIVNAAFFLFQTQSHDRYLFPLSVFLLLWGAFFVSRPQTDNKQIVKLLYCYIDKRRFKLFSTFYLLFTLFYFYNLHTALVVNYPRNGLPLLSSLTQPFFTITTSWVFLILFGVFVFWLAKSSRVTCYLLLVTGGIFASGLLILNKPLFTKQPVSLTRFTPVISEQAYGSRQTNRTVQSSFGGPNSWTRLSVQYAFYKEGIGTHANSRHVFDVNRKFSRFTTDYGIDTEAGTQASALFEIYGDGKLLFRSEKMGRFNLPQHLEVDIKGVKFLSLVTTDAADGNFDDHTDWLQPTLWP